MTTSKGPNLSASSSRVSGKSFTPRLHSTRLQPFSPPMTVVTPPRRRTSTVITTWIVKSRRKGRRKCSSSMTIDKHHKSHRIYREKSRSQSSTFWHIQEKQGFHFFMRKLGISTDQIGPPMKLIKWVNLTPSKMLYDKYFSRYDFLKIYLWKLWI